jgi:hypothetical protein
VVKILFSQFVNRKTPDDKISFREFIYLDKIKKRRGRDFTTVKFLTEFSFVTDALRFLPFALLKQKHRLSPSNPFQHQAVGVETISLTIKKRLFLTSV